MQTNTKNFQGTDQVAELMAPAPSRKVGKQTRAPLFEIPELRAARRFAANRHSALKKTEDIGYVDGFSDRHEVNHEFDSGAEWIAWLGGWRDGQAVRRRQRKDAARILASPLNS